MHKFLSEMIGTFALLFVGIMSIANNAGLLGIALAHGLVIAVMVMALGTISGGQLNPAVSMALSIVGKQSWAMTGQFIVAQFIGAALGGFAALAIAGHDTLAKAGYGQPVLGAGTSVGAGILGEAIATFFLLLVVLKVAVRQAHPLGGLIVGLTVALNILALGGQTGGAQNPVREFGAAIISGNWSNMIVYIVGPLLGAAIAAGVALYFWKMPELHSNQN